MARKEEPIQIDRAASKSLQESIERDTQEYMSYAFVEQRSLTGDDWAKYENLKLKIVTYLHRVFATDLCLFNFPKERPLSKRKYLEFVDDAVEKTLNVFGIEMEGSLTNEWVDTGLEDGLSNYIIEYANKKWSEVASQSRER